MSETINKIKQGSGIYLKIGFILFLILFLMIPNAFISDLIRERASLKHAVLSELSQTWGTDQYISGPVIIVPIEEKIVSKGEIEIIKSHLTILAEDLNINNKIAHEIRKRSIYEAILYVDDIEISGKFNLDKLITDKIENVKILWDEASVNIGISDSHAINSVDKLNFNGKEYELNPGVLITQMLGIGIHSKLIIDPTQLIQEFKLKLNLRGSTSIAFEPTARNTTITMIADWPSPSFFGSNFPIERNITKEHFDAVWKTSQFSRNYPDYWQGDLYRLNDHDNKMGVKLIQTVDHYQKNTRSSKYALLIIGLTFFIFFFFEYLMKNKIHPLQYAMVGLALSVFYLLLIALSEHIGFDLSYWISAAAITLLISYYTSAILKQRKTLITLTVVLLLLYAYIYVILQLEDVALLAGSIGLFVILSGIMILSRKVDWYNVGKE